jgi:hypothetical protein
MSLALSILSQPGYQFINLSPNPRAIQIFDRLGFRTVRRSLVVVANPAAVLASRRHLTGPSRSTKLDGCAKHLPPHAASVGHLV